MDDIDRFELDRVDVYANHLYMASFGRKLAHRLREEAEQERTVRDVAYLEGYARAIDDVSAHLEAGEGLPGGPLYLHAAASFADEERGSR